MVLDVGSSFVFGKAFEGIAEAESLAEGFKSGGFELGAQGQLTEKDHGDGGGFVKVSVGHEAEILKGGVVEQVSFINDDQRGFAFFHEVIGKELIDLHDDVLAVALGL